VFTDGCTIVRSPEVAIAERRMQKMSASGLIAETALAPARDQNGVRLK
jgi:hypothetical protein